MDGHNNPQARPTASEWKDVLITYKHELNDCTNNPNHSYWEQLSCCPYCEADARTKLVLNPSLKSTNFMPANSVLNCNTTPLVHKFSPAIVNKRATKRRILFWIVTLLLIALFSGVAWLDNGHWSFFVGGLCGTLLYNLRINKKQAIRWYYYIFSFLCGMVGMIVPVLIPYIIPILFIIAFLAGLLS